MKVILLGELKGKGGEGDVVEVAQGFAENYLFPNRMALPATKGNMKQLEERRHNIAKREEKRIADAEALKAALDGKTVLIDAKVGDEGQLFGSVTNVMVADAVKNELGVEVDRKRIELNRAIKTSGLHTVKVSLYREITAELNLQVGKPAVEEVVEEAPEAEVVETEAAEENPEATEAAE
ncbi:50S ribosomal protein L9 [uncultured Parolsenella sp.]|uniref:50S ribosomal protein L9 n=1 Tax=uncultured Parolsenella sp. TaxID=2083008 RepID=UPI0025EF8AF3|nr:50S ribosomal protein L9 [uncultured Parolsenella sp.]